MGANALRSSLILSCSFEIDEGGTKQVILRPGMDRLILEFFIVSWLGIYKERDNRSETFCIFHRSPAKSSSGVFKLSMNHSAPLGCVRVRSPRLVIRDEGKITILWHHEGTAIVSVESPIPCSNPLVCKKRRPSSPLAHSNEELAVKCHCR